MNKQTNHGPQHCISLKFNIQCFEMDAMYEPCLCGIFSLPISVSITASYGQAMLPLRYTMFWAAQEGGCGKPFFDWTIYCDMTQFAKANVFKFIALRNNYNIHTQFINCNQYRITFDANWCNFFARINSEWESVENLMLCYQTVYGK